MILQRHTAITDACQSVCPEPCTSESLPLPPHLRGTLLGFRSSAFEVLYEGVMCCGSGSQGQPLSAVCHGVLPSLTEILRKAQLLGQQEVEAARAAGIPALPGGGLQLFNKAKFMPRLFYIHLHTSKFGDT